MRVIVELPTFHSYANKDDIRFSLACEVCSEIAKHGLEGIVVNASPSDDIREVMRNSGVDGNGKECVRVVKQTFVGKKGAALREGISLAKESLGNEVGVIAFQEREKVEMVKEWKNVAALLETADICVPIRSETAFKESYPIEQIPLGVICQSAFQYPWKRGGLASH